MKRKLTYILADATIGKPTVLNRRKNKVTLCMSTEIIWQVTFVDRLVNLCCASRNRTQSTDVDDHQPHVLPAVVVPIQEVAARRVWYMSFYAINVESPTLVRPAGPWRLVSLSIVLMQGRAL